MRQILTTTPAVLTGLTVSTRYTFQNKSHHVVHVEHAAAAPTDAGGAFDFAPGAHGVISKAGANEIYVWVSDERYSGVIVYDEAP